MFGGFPKKLSRWVEADLITAEQSEKILAYEKEYKSGDLARQLTKVGVFAIFLGFLSIIGANWQNIGPDTKLILHTLLNLGVVGGILAFDPIRHPHKRDLCVTALFGLFLTFIALIAQIYQLHGDLYKTLLFWVGISTPFIWYWGRTYTAIMPWLIAALVAIFMTLVEVADIQDHIELVIPVAAFYMPGLMLLAAKSDWLQTHRPGFVFAFYRSGIALLAIFATIASLFFYAPTRVTEYYGWSLAVLASGILLVPLLFKPKPGKVDLRLFIIISGAMILMPVALTSVGGSFISAILFILYWIFLAWTGAQIHSRLLTDTAIRMIILRLCIVYVEVFGSLMATGFGLILSGVLLVLLIKNLPKLMALGRKWVKI